MARRIRGLLGAALVAGVLVGCGGGGGAEGPAVTSIGGADSACPLPVTFDVAELRKAKRTDSRNCEVEVGTEAGRVSFGVHVPDPWPGYRTPRSVMDTAAGVWMSNYGEYESDHSTDESDVASSPALEWDHRVSPPDSSIKPYRVRRLVVVTHQGTVVVTVMGSDASTLRAMRLVRSSMKVNPADALLCGPRPRLDGGHTVCA